jgi:hypothetical protein
VTSRVPIAVAMVVALGAALAWLQGRFDGTDVRRGIQEALRHQPTPGGPSVFDALAALGEGDPRCDGEVVSRLLADVRVACSTPRRPEVPYTFRVLVGGGRSPRPESPAARTLLDDLARPR